jgi:flagellar biosynthetic protein FliQ
MTPVIADINENAYQPYMSEQITFQQAVERGMGPVREFMLRQTRQKDLALFINMSGDDRPDSLDQVSSRALIPAFIISELKTAFQMGFMLFIPFLVIDMVVASTLDVHGNDDAAAGNDFTAFQDTAFYYGRRLEPGGTISCHRVQVRGCNMGQYQVLDIATDALYTIIIVSMPMLGLALLVGLIVSIFQAATQIQEPTLTFIPKILAVFFSLLVFGSWMLSTIMDFTIRLFSSINKIMY